jgi:hypothetical protein
MTNMHSQIAVILQREIEISRRVSLVERLQRISGVIEARLDSSDHRHLTITFRAGSLSPVTLLDFLTSHNAAASLALANERPDAVSK